MATLRRGARLGKYRLDRHVGRGAFAQVWRARDLVERRNVALKVSPPSLAEEWGREAIEHEAAVAARLDHPNVVRLFNADWIEGHFAMATELGRASLAQSRGARRSGDVALRVVRDVVAGLAHAHERRVLHRDLKPENVMIMSDRRAALADFGTARHAPRASFNYLTEAGTLGYMAPEQAYGKPRYASDVFAVGLIAYELLTGQLPTWPFDWPLEAHRRFEQRVPEPVRPVLRRALAVDLEQRWASGGELHAALERAFARIEKPRPARRRRPRRPEATPFELEARLFKRTHGRALELRYTCHRCEGPISEAMTTCPWCGTGENSLRETSRYPLVCPECEHGVRAEWEHCPWCYAGRLEGNGRAPRPDARAERRCSRAGCDGELRPFMKYCPRCGTKARRPWIHADLDTRCPRCRWSVHASWRHCPWCARRLSGAHAAPAPVR